MARTINRTRSKPEARDDDGYDEEETRPARRSSRRSSDEDTPRRSSRKESNGARSSAGGRGWKTHQQNKAKSSKFDAGDRFTVGDDQELIKFLEEEPFWSWLEHWVNEITDGRKSFACLDEDCPLCEYGVPRSERAAFNIVTFDKKGNPEVKFWIASPGPLGEIEERADDRMTSPIDRDDLYFAVSKKKKNRFWEYKLEAVDADKTERYFDVSPLEDSELDELKEELFDKDDAVQLSSRKELNEVVAELED